MAAQSYEVLVGLSWEPNRRAEPGDIVDDLPAPSIRHELEAGHIRPIPVIVPSSTPGVVTAKLEVPSVQPA